MLLERHDLLLSSVVEMERRRPLDMPHRSVVETVHRNLPNIPDVRLRVHGDNGGVNDVALWSDSDAMSSASETQRRTTARRLEHRTCIGARRHSTKNV